MAEVQESVRHMRDVIVAISRGLLVGVDDLAAGRVFAGTGEPQEDGRKAAAAPEPAEAGRRERQEVTRVQRDPRAKRNALDGKQYWAKASRVNIVLRGLPEWLKERQQAATGSSSSSSGSSSGQEPSSEEGGGSGSELSEEEGSESSSSSSSDSFLEFSPHDLADSFEDEEAQLRLAAEAQKRAAALVKKLKIDQRVDLIEQVSSWYQRHYPAAQRELENMSMQVDFRDEVQRSFNQGLTTLKEEVSAKEISPLVKVHEFLTKLHSLGANSNTQHKKPKLEMKRWSVIDRQNRLQKKIADARKDIAKIQESDKVVEAEEKPKDAPNAADLLRIVAEQQDELAALCTSSALTSQRLATIQACSDFVKSAQAAKAGGLRPAAAPADRDASELFQEVRRSVLRRALRQRMEEDSVFCRSVWKVVEADKAKTAGQEAKRPALKEPAPQAAPQADSQRRELERGCVALEKEIEHLQALKDSGSVEEEVLDILAKAADKVGERQLAAVSKASISSAEGPGDELLGAYSSHAGTPISRAAGGSSASLGESLAPEKSGFGDWLGDAREGLPRSGTGSPLKRALHRRGGPSDIATDDGDAEYTEGERQGAAAGGSAASSDFEPLAPGLPKHFENLAGAAKAAARSASAAAAAYTGAASGSPSSPSRAGASRAAAGGGSAAGQAAHSSPRAASKASGSEARAQQGPGSPAELGQGEPSPEKLTGRLEQLKSESSALKSEAAALEARLASLRRMKAAARSSMFLRRLSASAAPDREREELPKDPAAPAGAARASSASAAVPAGQQPAGAQLPELAPQRSERSMGAASGSSRRRRSVIKKKEEVQQVQEANKQLLEQLQALEGRLASAKRAAGAGSAEDPERLEAVGQDDGSDLDGDSEEDLLSSSSGLSDEEEEEEEEEAGGGEDEVAELRDMHRQTLLLQKELQFMDEQIKVARSSTSAAPAAGAPLPGQRPTEEVRPELLKELQEKEQQVQRLRAAWRDSQTLAKASRVNRRSSTARAAFSQGEGGRGEEDGAGGEPSPRGTFAKVRSSLEVAEENAEEAEEEEEATEEAQADELDPA